MLDRGLSDAVKIAAFIRPPGITAAEIAELRKQERKELSQGPEEEQTTGWIKRVLPAWVHKRAIAAPEERAAPALDPAPTEPVTPPDAENVAADVTAT